MIFRLVCYCSAYLGHYEQGIILCKTTDYYRLLWTTTGITSDYLGLRTIDVGLRIAPPHPISYYVCNYNSKNNAVGTP